MVIAELKIDAIIISSSPRRSSAIKSPRTETDESEGKSSGGGHIMPNKKLSWFTPKTKHAVVAVMVVNTLTRTLMPKKKKKEEEEEESHARRRGSDESPEDDDDDGSDGSGSRSDEEEDGGDSSSFLSSSSSSSSIDSASSSSSSGEEATTMTQSNNGGETKDRNNEVPKKSSRDERAINNDQRRRNTDTNNGGVGALSSTPRSDYIIAVVSATPIIAKGEMPNSNNNNDDYVVITNSGAGNVDDDGDGNYSDSSSENCGCGTYRGRGSLSSSSRSSSSSDDGSSHRSSNGGGSMSSSRGSSSRRDSSSSSSSNEGGRSISSSSSSSDSLSMKSSITKDTISHAIVDDDDENENEELEDASTDDDDDDNDTNHLNTVQLSQPTLSEWTEGVNFETSTSSLEELVKEQRQREEQIKKGEDDASIITTPTTTATTTEMQWLKPKAIAIRAAVGMHGKPTRRASAADAAKTKSSNSSLRSLFHRSLSTGADSADAAATADQDSVSATTTAASTRWKNTQVAVAAAAAATTTTTKKAEIAATKIQSLRPSIYNDEQISMMMQRRNSFRGGKGRGGGMQRTGSSTRLIDRKGLPPRPSRAFTVDSNMEDDANANDDDEEEDEEDVDFTDLLQKVKIARTALDRWKGMVTKNLLERSNDDKETIMDDNMMMTKKDTLVDEVQSDSPSLDNVYTKDDDEVTGKRLSSHVSSVMTELKTSSKHSNGDGVSACRMSEVMPSENYDAPIYASTIELAQLRLMKAMKRVDNVSECTPKQEMYTAKKELCDAKAHLETLRMMINNTLYCGTSTEGYITDVPSLPVETEKHKIDGHRIQTNVTNDTHSSSVCELVNEFSDNDLIDDTSSTDDDYTDNDYYSTEEYRLSVIEEIESVDSVDTPTDTYDDQSLCTRDDNELVVCATTECNAINNTNLASSTCEEDVGAQTVVNSECLDETEMSSHQQRSSISTCSETLSPSPELKHSISRYSTTADVLRIFDELCCISTTNSHMQESNDPHLLMPMGISTDLDSKWLLTTSSSEIESRVLHTQFMVIKYNRIN